NNEMTSRLNGCHILSSLKKLCPQSLGRNLCSGCRVDEKVLVFLLHLVFTFPGSSMKFNLSSTWISSNGIASGSSAMWKRIFKKRNKEKSKAKVSQKSATRRKYNLRG
ncbi:hypothetical protein Tco_1291002, partial [Tanacetum coccineum]